MGKASDRCVEQCPNLIHREGKQYITMGVGNGGAQATGFAALVPEIQNLDRAPVVRLFQFQFP